MRRAFTRYARMLGLASLGVAATVGGASAASAQACAGAAVTARGEPARFEWLAKTKAKANWRRRVRAMTTLGPDYANWARARDTAERCMAGPKGTVCVFTGTPCKP